MKGYATQIDVMTIYISIRGRETTSCVDKPAGPAFSTESMLLHLEVN